MFSCLITRGLVKHNRFCITVYRRFSEVNENLVKIFKNLRDAQNPGELYNYSLEFDKYRESKPFLLVNPGKSLSLSEEEESARCVDQGSNLTSSSNPGSYNEWYDQSRDLILDSFTNTLRLSCTNFGLVSFFADSIDSILHELDFSQIYKLINSILAAELRDSPTDDKIYSLLQKLLVRVNFLITEKISYAKGIVKVNRLHKYPQTQPQHLMDPRLGLDLSSDDHLEKLWNMWYKLSKKYQSESRYTISLLMSLLEMETRKIFQFDLLRVLRVLDTVVGDSKSFSKLDERVILRLLKRFVGLMAQVNQEADPNTFIKSNNVTPVQIKKFMCNIAKISKLSHHTLAETFNLKNSYSSFENFFKISKEVVRNELHKIQSSSKSTHNDKDLSDFYAKTREEVLSKYSKLFTKIFCDAVDFLKLLDYINLGENTSNIKYSEDLTQPPRLKGGVVDFCNQILSKVHPNSQDLVLSECRSMYYLVLTSLISGTEDETVEGFTKTELVKVVSSKISDNCERLIKANNSLLEVENSEYEAVKSGFNQSNQGSLKNNEGISKSVQYLLYCDKINNIFKNIKIDLEVKETVHSSSCALAESLSLVYKSVLVQRESHWVKTLYITLMNKYQLLSPEMYSDFVEGLGNWERWNRREISMLCDLFSRTHGQLLDKATTPSDNQTPVKSSIKGSMVERLSNKLQSLVKFLFLDGNSSKMGNRDFISFLTAMHHYKEHLETSKSSELGGEGGDFQGEFQLSRVEEQVKRELRQRVTDMNFSQLVKLLPVLGQNSPYSDLRNEVVEALSNLDHLGDVSCLADLRDPEITQRVLSRFEVVLVSQNYILFEKFIKFKFLNRFGSLRPSTTYSTPEAYALMREDL